MPTRKQERKKRAANRAAQTTRTSEPKVAEIPPVEATQPREEVHREAPAFVRSTKHGIAGLVAKSWFPVACLVLIYVVSVVVSSLLARKQAIPNLLPDEMYYGKLSQGLAFGDGMQWRGFDYGLPPLWPALLALAWHGGSVPDGYATAKTLGSIVVSTTVVPVWLLARAYVGPRLALIPALLVVMGAWMQVSDFLVSENLAFPLATASLACTVTALWDLRMRWIGLSLAFAVLATLTRTQMFVLPVILVLALVFDILRQPRDDWRGRVDARPRWLWIGLTAAVVLGLLAFIVKPDLTHYDLLSHHASIGKIISSTWHEGIDAVALYAFVPLVAAIGLMARKENWRDERTGALLVTLIAGVLVLFPVIGRFISWATSGIPVDRYAMYLAPLLLVALVVAPGRIGRRTTLVAAVVVGALMIGAAKITNFLEQAGNYGIQKALFDNGVSTAHLKLGTVIVAFAVAIGGALLLTMRRRSTGLALAFLLCATLMVVQGWASRSYEYDLAKANRTVYVPTRMDWVDHYAKGPVAMLDVGKNVPLRANPVIFSEFFNKKIKWYYSTIATGNACDVDLTKTGGIKHGDSTCKVWPREWVLADGPVTATLKGQKLLATTARSGSLVRIPPGAPRLQALVGPPCTRYGCTSEFQLGTYLDKPATVTVAFGPGKIDHRIQVGGNKIQTLPAGKPVNVNFKIPAGPQAANIPVDWSDPDGAPQLEGVVIKTSDGKTLRVY